MLFFQHQAPVATIFLIKSPFILPLAAIFSENIYPLPAVKLAAARPLHLDSIAYICSSRRWLRIFPEYCR